MYFIRFSYFYYSWVIKNFVQLCPLFDFVLFCASHNGGSVSSWDINCVMYVIAWKNGQTHVNAKVRHFLIFVALFMFFYSWLSVLIVLWSMIWICLCLSTIQSVWLPCAKWSCLGWHGVLLKCINHFWLWIFTIYLHVLYFIMCYCITVSIQIGFPYYYVPVL